MQAWRTIKLAGIELIEGVYVVDIQIDKLPDLETQIDTKHIIRFGVCSSSRSLHRGYQTNFVFFFSVNSQIFYKKSKKKKFVVTT